MQQIRGREREKGKEKEMFGSSPDNGSEVNVLAHLAASLRLKKVRKLQREGGGGVGRRYRNQKRKKKEGNPSRGKK